MRLKEYNSLQLIFTFILIFILWQIISEIFRLPILPSPLDILINIVGSIESEISIHVLYSLKRIVIGIFFTLLIGVPLGILMGYFEKIDMLLSPILYFNYPVPKIALLPIVMLLFGLGDITKMIMIFLITFFPIVVNIRDEVKNIPREVFYPMYSLGANKLEIIKEIILPGIIPALLTSLRIGIGTAISVLFFTENFGTQYGMGYFIMDSWMRINYIQMYSGILILSIIGLIFFITIDILETILCPWRG
ncbi:ABC transporter permease [Maledivibacter halophilus]|uniref:NitT/TauT family transport system permease protein n=1 Tax=Maledivibacter halophilus TaxID=36842 RepID=A0A1T5IRG1_9FIRM|nr:ABC transporter permease [Maledivibacter halophilus]SKC41705.1 NitT/TauT family transport system permease protein [Maledivibacter halophilus]